MKAFPRNRTAGQEGMDLRDYFAGQAIIGILSNAASADARVLVKDAFRIADLMLKARQS